MAMTLREFKPYTKNTLRGFATVEFPSGIVIHDITVHTKNGKSWVAFPAMPHLDNGQHRVVDGRNQYKRIIEWRDRDLSDRFSETLVGLIEELHPSAFS